MAANDQLSGTELNRHQIVASVVDKGAQAVLEERGTSSLLFD
jgi:hypothetical protein